MKRLCIPSPRATDAGSHPHCRFHQLVPARPCPRGPRRPHHSPNGFVSRDVPRENQCANSLPCIFTTVFSPSPKSDPLSPLQNLRRKVVSCIFAAKFIFKSFTKSQADLASYEGSDDWLTEVPGRRVLSPSHRVHPCQPDTETPRPSALSLSARGGGRIPGCTRKLSCLVYGSWD